MMKKSIKSASRLMFTACALTLAGWQCNSPANEQEATPAADTTQSNPNTADFAALPPDATGLTDEAFGKIIPLTGKAQPIAPMFRVTESELMATDSVLLINNLHDGQFIMWLSTNDFSHLASFARQGRGPNEFIYPTFVQGDDPETLCHIFERTDNKLYAVYPNFQMKERKDMALRPSVRGMYSDKQLYAMGPDHFVYAESSDKGKGLFETKREGDSLVTRQFYDLSFSEDHANWAAYIGSFGANAQKHRLVYAYKYFKRAVFIDTQTGQHRVIQFKTDETESGDVHAMMSPDNVTHYWKLSAQPDYVYLLYSGRTPYEVGNANNQGNAHIFVEQFDWNGNPIRKFRLDQWGYFCADEYKQRLYLLSTTEAEPLYVYNLPEM
jgi:hypothetical protein